MALLIAASACASSAEAAAPGPQLNVRLADFTMTTNRSSIPAGWVTVHVTNRGPSTHSVRIDRTELQAGALPMQKDNLTVNEHGSGMRAIGSIAAVDLDGSADLRLNLRPGHYVLWCHRSGHYLGGMYTSLTVR